MSGATPARQREDRILAALADGDPEMGFYSFHGIKTRSGIDDVRQIRIDVRRLARKGLAQFGKGLWSYDGDPRGSGYAITEAGRKRLAETGERA